MMARTQPSVETSLLNASQFVVGESVAVPTKTLEYLLQNLDREASKCGRQHSSLASDFLVV